MTDYLVMPLILVASCLLLASLLIAKGLRHVARKLFLFFLASMALWGASIFMMRSSSDLSVAFFWDKLVFIAIMSASILFYQFTLSFTGTQVSKKLLYGLYLLYIVFLALILTGLVISGMQMMWYGKAPIRGLLFFPYVLFVYVPIVLTLIALLRHYRQSRIIDEKIRCSYMATGVIIMVIGGTTDYLPPLGINIYPMGIISNIIFCLLATVAMLRYGLLEFPAVLRRSGAAIIVGLLGVGIVVFSTFVINALVGNIGLLGILFTASVVLLSIVPIAQPAVPKLQSWLNRLFYGARYDHLEALERFNRETKGVNDLGGMTSHLINIIAHGMQCKSVFLLLKDSQTGRLVTHSRYVRSGETNFAEISFLPDSLLVQAMKFENNLIDVQRIDYDPSLRAISDQTKQFLVRNGIELLVPLKAAERVIGILLIGDKTNNQPFSTYERRLLDVISRQGSLAIENARLFSEEAAQRRRVEKFNVERATFLDALAHELKTPLTSALSSTKGINR
jgi:hypothetical protein